MPDDGAVNEIISEVFQKLSSAAPKSTSDGSDVTEIEISVEAVQEGFDKVLASIREDDSIELRKRNRMIAELSLLKLDAEQDSANIQALQQPIDTLRISTPSSVLFDPAFAPYCVVTGSGQVGTALKQRLKQLGDVAEVRYLNGDQMNALTSSEVSYALRGAKTIILAVDADAPKTSKGLFGMSPPPFSMDERAIKRLLDILQEERQKLPADNRPPIRLVALGRAYRPKKSVASFLVGDTADFESEVILQCERRGLGYTIVCTGDIVPDQGPLGEGANAGPRRRGIVGRQVVVPSNPQEEDIAWPLPAQTLSIERGTVQPSEPTRLSTGVEGLLRAATTPVSANCSFAVLSLDDPTSVSSSRLLTPDEEWADELSKNEGPELLRIPLRFASTSQASVRLWRICLNLAQQDGGLVTPIDTVRFGNGVRVIFRPSASGYKSAAEERFDEMEAKEEAAAKTNAKMQQASARGGGYVSPEEEELFEKTKRDLQQTAILSPEDLVTRRKASGADKRKKNGTKKEGGLEIIVESAPYPRVRVRRTNMDKETIVKVESEQTILKALEAGIRGLERDYKTLLTRSEK